MLAPDGRVPAGRGLGSWLARIAPPRARGEVTVALVGDPRMRALNRMFRGRDEATDVLSFAGSGERDVARRPPRVGTPVRGWSRGRDAVPLLGDIVIATGVAARQAREHGHAVSVELRLLALHGLLHLLGYDHDDPADEGRMARAEHRLRARAGLPSGVIARVGRRVPGRLVHGGRRRP